MDPVTLLILILLLIIIFGAGGVHLVGNVAIGLWDVIVLVVIVALIYWLITALRRP